MVVLAAGFDEGCDSGEGVGWFGVDGGYQVG